MTDERTLTAEPVTEAGREWLASIERNGGPSQRARDRILAIEAEAVQRSTAELERLQEALLTSANALDAVGQDSGEAVDVRASAIAAVMRRAAHDDSEYICDVGEIRTEQLDEEEVRVLDQYREARRQVLGAVELVFVVVPIDRELFVQYGEEALIEATKAVTMRAVVDWLKSGISDGK
jgi:hypothetical protein